MRLILIVCALMLGVAGCAGGKGEKQGSGSDMPGAERADSGSNMPGGENTESGEPGGGENPQETDTEWGTDRMENGKLGIRVGDRVMKAVFEDNSSAEAFRERLREGEITVAMSDYGDFEKVGPLGMTLPRNDRQITTVPGDVILYQGNQITIYYDTNSWNFTRLAKIEELTQEEIKAVLGDGDVTVTFFLTE